MKSIIQLPVLFFVSIVVCQAAWSWYPATRLGMPLPGVSVINERGQQIDVHSVFQSGSHEPALLVPVFTRCRMSCPVLVASMEKALASVQAKGRDLFRVVLISFDARDTTADLKTFRERESVPSNWVIVRAHDPGTIRQFFDRYSFSIMDSDGGFSHPSQVFVLNSSLQWIGSLLGPNLTPQDLRTAYESAEESEESGIVAALKRSYANPESLLIFGAAGLCLSLVLLVFLLMRMKPSVGSETFDTAISDRSGV